MKNFFQKFRTFTQNLGLVEQAQIVASTAVVVIMVTIISANILLNLVLTPFDFISIITVGIIGFASVYFSLKYGRQLETQKRELEALNRVAESVNQSIDLDYLLSNVLQKVVELARTEYGWLYIVEGKKLVLRNSSGAEFSFFNEKTLANLELIPWVQKIHTQKEEAIASTSFADPSVHRAGISSWVSVPLRAADQFAGVLLLATTVKGFFSERQVDLIAAFGNHINVALNNAHLFDRLRKSEQQYADLFEHSPDMYHLVNREGIIISCNQTEAQTLGYQKTDIIGHPLTRLYPPEYRLNVLETLLKAFENGHEFRGMEEQMTKRDGAVIDVSVNTSLVYDDKRIPVLMRCVVRDITEKKKLEQKIMQAQKIDSIGNLAGGVAHDFNNILASILGSASIMHRRMKEEDKWFPFVEIIETAAKRGAALTRQLLTFARRSNVEIHPVDIHAILEETIHLFERSVNPNINIVQNFISDVAIVNGDEGQIQQAMLNIFINARDAMPGGGTLTIETSSVHYSEQDRSILTGETRSGSYIAIKAMDTGIGMSKDTQQRMFEPFFTTKEQGKGTGLGLSVVYGVVNGHGGYISVQSEPGKGTTFSILLPKLPETFTARTSHSSKKIVGGKESILVVDDEESVCTTISAMLVDLGYSVQATRSGKEALAILSKRNKIHLVLLDMTMPEMGGKEVFQKIRRMKSRARVIISSGYSDSILGEDTFAKNVDGFLQKPYRIEDLSKKIREVLDRNGKP
jgi:PAS domain S-box-containing protein